MTFVVGWALNVTSMGGGGGGGKKEKATVQNKVKKHTNQSSNKLYHCI